MALLHLCNVALRYGWLLLLLAPAAYAQSQPPQKEPFVLGHTDRIKSTQLQEERVLNIYLPEGYANDPKVTYPVIYLLDGSADEDFIHIVGLVQYLTFPWIDVLPKSIVVGIGTVDRRRDFTFPTRNKKDLQDFPTTGKSAAFMRFIEQDLQPYVERTYRTNGQKTLIGQSLGGLLATEVLLKKPALFNTYIIASPSLWWDNESLVTQAPALLKQAAPTTPANVFVALGNEGPEMKKATEAMIALLRAAPARAGRVAYVPFPEETHATILHRAVYKAFETLYKKPK
ncbi:alpha/beta hydrolase-fold protein [Hymenobacter sp. 5516J-16]|uniref:alpha/beta hydrolase n=1 Tax=Hymenobacter sp. 5516J-16 TaxID=2932253 RepID=UPI001FD40660|nr:alpha/beta hydrolase-fold protein [Hymenobacter sp. 5516J-16]UOQ76203.1 alpha/beta hydrolase-fold protein [Hymenobacter sp. 5516J-16]